MSYRVLVDMPDFGLVAGDIVELTVDGESSAYTKSGSGMLIALDQVEGNERFEKCEE